MDPIRKTAAALIVVWICLNLYLAVGDELAFLNVEALPLSTAYSIYRPVPIWASASTVIGLAFILSVRFPRQQVAS
jgi:hypothetical protein